MQLHGMARILVMRFSYLTQPCVCVHKRGLTIDGGGIPPEKLANRTKKTKKMFYLAVTPRADNTSCSVFSSNGFDWSEQTGKRHRLGREIQPPPLPHPKGMQ